jgi:hypothetical protein
MNHDVYVLYTYTQRKPVDIQKRIKKLDIFFSILIFSNFFYWFECFNNFKNYLKKKFIKKINLFIDINISNRNISIFLRTRGRLFPCILIIL